MANGLTSSDIQRQRLGFGVSPDTESRRRAIEAGVSPLTTEERIRKEWGFGPSEFASPESRRAFQAAEVIGRGGPISEMPVEYGGRPTGTSRRALRMQAEYDEAQNRLLEQQRIVQAMDLQQRAESRLQRAQDLEMEKYRLGEERESRVVDEAGMIVDAIRGEIGPDGKVIAKPIRPEDDDAIERLEGLGRFKFGMENKSAQDMWSNLYNDALKFREDRINQSKQQELAAINLSVRTGKPFEEFGTYNEQGLFQPKLQGMIAGTEEVKAAEEAKAQESTIATEKRRAEAQAGVAEKKTKESQQREIQRNIRKATEDLRKINASLAGRKSLSESQRASLTSAKDALIDLQIERAALDNLAFETPEAYGAALKEGRTFPSGTTIYIGRTPVKVK